MVAAKRLIEEGRIGEVVSVRTHYSGNMDIEDGAWRGDAAIGGSLMEMACHRQARPPYLVVYASRGPGERRGLVRYDPGGRLPRLGCQTMRQGPG